MIQFQIQGFRAALVCSITFIFVACAPDWHANKGVSSSENIGNGRNDDRNDTARLSSDHTSLPAPGLGPTAQGTETHGGDVLTARALKIKEQLSRPKKPLLPPDPKFSDKFDDNTSDGAGMSRRSFKENMRVLWSGLYASVDQLDGQKKNLIHKMIKGDQWGSIFQDINNSPYEPTGFTNGSCLNNTSSSTANTPPPESESPRCIDHQGRISTAAAQLNARGVETEKDRAICFDVCLLAQGSPTEYELLAIASHEHAHHFGADEANAVELQTFINLHWAELMRIGSKMEPLLFQMNPKMVPIDSLSDQPLTLRVSYTNPSSQFALYIPSVRIFSAIDVPINRDIYPTGNDFSGTSSDEKLKCQVSRCLRPGDTRTWDFPIRPSELRQKALVMTVHSFYVYNIGIGSFMNDSALEPLMKALTVKNIGRELPDLALSNNDTNEKIREFLEKSGEYRKRFDQAKIHVQILRKDEPLTNTEITADLSGSLVKKSPLPWMTDPDDGYWETNLIYYFE